MRLCTLMKDGEFVVRITGDIDHHASPGIREQIDRQVVDLAPKRLILDLGSTDFMDSSGLGLILGRLRLCEESGIRFTLVNPSGAVMKILRLAGVEKRLDIQYL